MRAIHLACAAIVAVTLVGAPRDAAAQTAEQAQQIQQQIDQLRQELTQRIAALEAQLAAIQGGPPAPGTAPTPAPPAAAAAPVDVPAGAAGAGGPSGTLPVYGNVSAASKIFNPDMAVIGDFLGAAGRNPADPQPALEMHESEASF